VQLLIGPERNSDISQLLLACQDASLTAMLGGGAIVHVGEGVLSAAII
jgi:hypothetical protein